MATTTGSFKLYNSFLKAFSDGTIDLDTDAFKVSLHTSAYAALDTTHLEAHSLYADLTNELATNFGYTNGGQLLSGISLTRLLEEVTFTCDNPSWSVSGGSLVERYFIIRKSTGSEELVGVGYLDSTPLDVTTITATDLTISINGNGLFTINK